MTTMLLPHLESMLLFGAVTTYFVAMLVLWAHLFFRGSGGGDFDSNPEFPEVTRKAWRSPAKISRFWLWLGVVLHLLALIGEGSVVFTDKAGVASLFGWVLAVVYLTVGHRLFGLSLGAFITPIALLGALYAVTARALHPNAPPRAVEMQWLIIHVVVILTAYVALALAFAASLIYLLQDGLLKRKKLTGLWQRLPSLHVADDWIYRGTSFGLAMLTIGIVTSVAWQQLEFPTFAVLRDPKVLLSLATWLTFALYLAARWWLGWSGRRSSLVVVCGFVLMLVSFLGTPHLLAVVGSQ